MEGEKRNRNRSVDQLETARQRAASVKTVRIDGEESVYSRSSGRSKGRHDEASIDDDIFNLSPDNSVRSRRTLRSDQYSGLIAEKENEEMNWARQALESSSRLKAMQSEHSEAVRAMEERSNVRSCVLIEPLLTLSCVVIRTSCRGSRRKYHWLRGGDRRLS